MILLHLPCFCVQLYTVVTKVDAADLMHVILKIRLSFCVILDIQLTCSILNYKV